MNDLPAKKLKENSKRHFDEASLRKEITAALSKCSPCVLSLLRHPDPGSTAIPDAGCETVGKPEKPAETFPDTALSGAGISLESISSTGRYSSIYSGCKA